MVKNFFMNFLFLISFLLIQQSVALAETIPTERLAEGDLIFQKSQSQQSKAILEATGSEWTHVGILLKHKQAWFVAEAVQPVKETPIDTWIARGRNHEYKIFRFPLLQASQLPLLYKTLNSYMGKNYDIYFEWTDDLIYCSELTYKVFQTVTGSGIGTLQKMKELRLNGPYVKALIQKRLTDTGRTLNPEELILTPISQMMDPRLIFIQD